MFSNPVVFLFLLINLADGFFDYSPTINEYPFEETEVKLPWYKETWLIPKQVRNRPLLDYKCECGIENTENGTEEFPWVVWITFWSISSDGNPKYEIKCSGSLINNLMILTNAQCVDKFKFSLAKAFYQWENQRVDVHMDSGQIPSATSIPIANVFFHPEYLKGVLDVDVAILQLKMPVPFKDPKNAIRPICLPARQDKFKEGSDGGVVLHYSDGSDNTNKIIVQNATTASMYHINECKKMFKQKISGNFICASPPSQLASKHFGSLLYLPLANDQNLQIGIWTSRHFGIRKNKLSTLNLFIRILDIVPFIEDASNEAGAKWCRHPRMKMNETIPNTRLPKDKTPWVGTNNTSDSRDIHPSCSCGYRKAKQQSRIVGGSEVTPYEYPWLVLLQMDGGGISEGCGGAVINDFFILTAAHCLYDATLAESDPSNPYPGRAPTSIAAAILVHSSEIINDKNAVVLEVEEVFIHPEFIESLKAPPYIMDYDLALLKLRVRLDFWSEDGPLPICLPNTGEMLHAVGKQAIVAGWGMTNPDNPNESLPGLQQLEIPVKPLQECKDLAATLVTDRMLCAGTFDPRKDTLHGDSGGPLMLELPTKQMTQIGIVSWGDYDIRKIYNLDTEKAAALYSDVQVNLEFIDYYSKLREAKWCSRDVPPRNPRRPWIDAKLPPRKMSSSCECGVRGERDTSGHTVVAPNEMLWLVLIMAVRESSTTYCTGSIINDLFIITSAECLKADEIVKNGSPSLPTTVIHVQPMFEERNIVDFQSTLIIDSIELHPAYLTTEEQFDHDVALIKLKDRIDFKNKYLAPACIQTFKEVEALKTTNINITSGLMTGWAKMSNKGQTEFKFHLKKQKLRKKSSCGIQTHLNREKKFICLESPTNLEPSFAGGQIQIELSKNHLVQIGIIPGKEQKQACVKSKKKKKDQTKSLNSKKISQNGTEPARLTPESENQPARRAAIFRKTNNAFLNDTLFKNASVKSVSNNNLTFSTAVLWDDMEASRMKRAEAKQCSMYTSISDDVLQFIEFFTSHAEAVWCDKVIIAPEPIKVMKSANDFGMKD